MNQRANEARAGYMAVGRQWLARHGSAYVVAPLTRRLRRVRSWWLALSRQRRAVVGTATLVAGWIVLGALDGAHHIPTARDYADFLDAVWPEVVGVAVGVPIALGLASKQQRRALLQARIDEHERGLAALTEIRWVLHKNASDVREIDFSMRQGQGFYSVALRVEEWRQLRWILWRWVDDALRADLTTYFENVAHIIELIARLRTYTIETERTLDFAPQLANRIRQDLLDAVALVVEWPLTGDLAALYDEAKLTRRVDRALDDLKLRGPEPYPLDMRTFFP